MYYTNGNYSMGGNFKIKKQAPMDDRSTVAKKIDLQNPNLFDGFTYNGMIVSVVDDTVNNGIYRLEDKNTLTWKKEGSDVNFTEALRDKLMKVSDNNRGAISNEDALSTITDPMEGDFVLNRDTLTFWAYESGAWVDIHSSTTAGIGDSAYDIWLQDPNNAGKTVEEYRASMKGARGLPGPKGQDGTVSFNDLTEEQKEELTRNKYVRTRTSNNFLYYNKNNNTAYLDIAPSQNLRIESMKVKTKEDAEYDIPTTQVIDEPNEIGEYRYINIDYKTDIFEDGSGIVHFPLSTGLTSIDGVHTFVPSEPDFNNPMFTMDNIDGVSKSTLDGRTNNATLACDTLTAVLPNKTNTCYSIFLKQNSTQANNFFMIRELGFMLHNNWIYIISPELNNDGWINTTKIPNGTWMHIVANIKNDVLASDYYVNGVKFPVERRVKVEIPGPVYPIAKLMKSPSTLQLFSFRVFNRHLTISEMNTLRTKISYNALEFYHGSGEKLTEAKMVNTTINLPVPKAPNEAGAKKLGLQKDDLYINSSNGLSIVTT